jgi:hypothetical protein
VCRFVSLLTKYWGCDSQHVLNACVSSNRFQLGGCPWNDPFRGFDRVVQFCDCKCSISQRFKLYVLIRRFRWWRYEVLLSEFNYNLRVCVERTRWARELVVLDPLVLVDCAVADWRWVFLRSTLLLKQRLDVWLDNRPCSVGSIVCSLRLRTLNVLQNSGTDDQKLYISGIIPLVKRHHLLLVTLLLANAAGNVDSERSLFFKVLYSLYYSIILILLYFSLWIAIYILFYDNACWFWNAFILYYSIILVMNWDLYFILLLSVLIIQSWKLCRYFLKN